MKSFVEFFLVKLSQNTDGDILEESIDSLDNKSRMQLKKIATLESQDWSIIPLILS